MIRVALAVFVLAGVVAAVAVALPRQEGEADAGTVVWAVGDGGIGTAAAKRLARRVAADEPRRFIYLGDVYPHGRASDFRRNYDPVYGSLARITLPVIGNHEYGTRRTGFFPYWRAKKNRSQPLWYRTRLAGWELIGLSSESPHGARSGQVRWLRRAVRGPGNCRLVFWHRPYMSAGRVHGGARDVAPFWNAIRGRARIVLGGHDHNLQRFKPRDGITQYVSGAGGNVRYALRRDRRLAFARSDRDGGLRIVLEPGRARLEFRTAGGKVLDRSSVTCSAQSS